MAESTTTEKLIKTANMLGEPFTLKSIDGFPYSEWTDLQSRYNKEEQWYTDEALEEKQTVGDRTIDTYPLKINPIKSAVRKHTYALFGEFPDDAPLLVSPKVIIKEEGEKESADQVEDALVKTYIANNMNSVLMQNGLLSQIHGGCVFKVSFVPDDESMIRIEMVSPKEFIGIPYGNNYWSLKEAWIVKRITKNDAYSLGVTIVSEYGYYIEKWTPDRIRISVNNDLATLNILGERIIGDRPNPFGIVPFIYIPHERTDKFYGTGIISDSAIGITKEINLRAADAGDATNDSSHGTLFMRNVKGSPKVVKVAGVSIIDLGSAQSISGKDLDPDVFTVTRSQIVDSMMRLNEDLRNDIRRELSVPPVAEGIDEGSQRSAATLVMRFWPLTSHVKSERAYWSTGLTVMNNMILAMMANKKLYNITKEHLKLSMKIKWHPILPRDRQAIQEEAVARMGVNLGSPELLLSILGDTEDIDTVMDQTKSWLEFLNELEVKKAESQAQSFQENNNGSQGNGGGSQKAQRDGGRSVSNRDKTTSDKRVEA